MDVQRSSKPFGGPFPFPRLAPLARAAWITVTILGLAAVLSILPTHYAQLAAPDPAVRAGLERLGIPAGLYAAVYLALGLLYVATYVTVAGVIVARKPGDRMALFVAFFLVALGTSTPLIASGSAGESGAVQVFAAVLNYSAWLSFNALFYVFPDGRLVPRWGWIPLALATLNMLLFSLPDTWPLSASHWPVWAVALLQAGIWGMALTAQIYRYRRVSDAIARRQTKWVVYGCAVGVVLATLFSLPGMLRPELLRPGMVYALLQEPVGILANLCVPVSVGLALLRYRLWDVDPILNRTLVYGALTACLVLFYVGVVTGLGLLFESTGSLAVSLAATGLVAVLFQPLRERLQRGIDRVMYGERDDPYRILSRLGKRLEATLEPETVLPTIVETVAQSLRLPYAAIALLSAEGEAHVVAEYGPAAAIRPSGAGESAPDGSVRLPLVYQQEHIGELMLAPRARGESFSPSDRRLLDDLAHHAGIAAHGVRLTADLQRLTGDLQRSRERLVLAREEERRRLRRDLHDGLAPTLAALALAAGNVGDLIPERPETARVLAFELEGEIRTAIADIRRLVYGLRPPALDQLGLVAAVRELAEQAGQAGGPGLRVRVEAPEHLPALPAAIDAAAYRIAQEALANVVRHARAQTCTIRMSWTEPEAQLRVEVVDDGVGLPAERHAGVGLLSMRERAAELGGTCVIEQVNGTGTRVWASLPVIQE